jgi:galactose-1-phosphate uridylyltransferase
VRFKQTVKEWYGWDLKKAEIEWANAVRDKANLRRNNKYGILEIASISDMCAKGSKKIKSAKEVTETEAWVCLVRFCRF